MRIVIAGAGSIGTVIGVLLADTDHEVLLLRRSGPSGEIDITITGEIDMTRQLRVITHDTTVTSPADIVLITVQEQHTTDLASQLKGSDLLTRSTILVSLQNGVNAATILTTMFPVHPVLAGTVWWSATLADPHTVLYHRQADTVLGIPEGSGANTSHLDIAYQLLDEVLALRSTDNIKQEQRRKLVLNVVSPPLALAKLPYPEGLANDDIRQVVHALFDEALETACLLDWQINEDDDQRLNDFHDMLISGDIPETNDDRQIQHKVSTQIGMEKYGGDDSNIRELLGWLQLSGSLLADEVINLAQQQSPDYEPVSPSVLRQIVEMTNSARCPRLPFETD